MLKTEKERQRQREIFVFQLREQHLLIIKVFGEIRVIKFLIPNPGKD